MTYKIENINDIFFYYQCPSMIKNVFEIVIPIVFQSVFRLEMHQNNILLLFLKNYF